MIKKEKAKVIASVCAFLLSDNIFTIKKKNNLMCESITHQIIHSNIHYLKEQCAVTLWVESTVMWAWLRCFQVLESTSCLHIPFVYISYIKISSYVNDSIARGEDGTLKREAHIFVSVSHFLTFQFPKNCVLITSQEPLRRTVCTHQLFWELKTNYLHQFITND